MLFGQDHYNVELLDNWQDSSLVSNSSEAKYNDCWGYEQNGIEYALVGSTEGIHFLKINDDATLNAEKRVNDQLYQLYEMEHKLYEMEQKILDLPGKDSTTRTDPPLIVKTKGSGLPVDEQVHSLAVQGDPEGYFKALGVGDKWAETFNGKKGRTNKEKTRRQKSKKQHWFWGFWGLGPGISGSCS